MVASSLRPLAAALLFLVLELSPIAAEDAVLTLTTANFDETIKNTKRILVEFYAPWCGHCKALAPEYEKAAQDLASQNLETKLAKVDATEEKELGERFGVSGYPTLKYFQQGQEPKAYDGGRTADEIKNWLRKREVPPYKTLEESEAEAFLQGTKEGEFAVLARVVKKSAKGKAVLAAAETLVSYEAATITVGVVFLPKTADAKADASITMVRPGFKDPDEVTVKYEGKWTDSNIVTWFMTSTYPWVGTKFTSVRYSTPAHEAMKKDGTLVAILDKAEEREQVLPELLAVAKTEPNYLVTTAVASDLQDYELTGLGASGTNTKAMATVVHDNKRYTLFGGIEAISAPGALKNLLASVKSKKAKPFYKTAAVPNPEVDEDGVTVLVGETFEKYVLNAKKDVFVEFYAPWCGHCKKLTPVWAELAKKAKASGWADKGLVIAKMDATENESEEQVDGFPKLVLYPAGKPDRKMKAKQVYNGARELDPLVDFLLENAKSLEGAEDTGGSQSSKQKYSMVDREREKKRKGKGGEL